MAKKIKSLRCLAPVAVMLLFSSVSYYIMYHQHGKKDDIIGDPLSSGVKQPTLPRRWSDMDDIPRRSSSKNELKNNNEKKDPGLVGSKGVKYNDMVDSNRKDFMHIQRPNSGKDLDRKDNQQDDDELNTDFGRIKTGISAQRSRLLIQANQAAKNAAENNGENDSDEFEEITLDENKKVKPPQPPQDKRAGQDGQRAIDRLPSIIGQKVYQGDFNSAGQKILETHAVQKVIETVLPTMQGNVGQLNLGQTGNLEGKTKSGRAAVNVVKGASNYILIHSGKASTVGSEIHEKVKTLPGDVLPEYYIFTADRFTQHYMLFYYCINYIHN